MSDAGCYADVLERKCTYTNTFYHCEPLLDIMQPKERWLGDNDFVITSDVFEHVPPPIQRAFDNLLALLKPGGVTIFSVPYTLQSDTLEHYPNLRDFSIRQDEKGEWVLDNVTQQGVKEEFRDLIFHGGPGSTLELRVFGLPALKAHFEASGFTDVRIHSEPYFEYGIFWLHPWSLVISALRPR
jgi:SAM-dependent methyltransferase